MCCTATSGRATCCGGRTGAWCSPTGSREEGGDAAAPPSGPAGEEPAPAPPPEGGAGEDAGDPAEDQPAAPPADAPAPEQLAAAGLEPCTDGSGFQLAVPAGWEVSVEEGGSEVYSRDPASSRFLLVAQTDRPQPDALEDLRVREAEAARTDPDYELVRLEPITVDAAPDAAEWEYRTGEGGSTHVLNRNLRVSDTSAYAPSSSAPHDSWGEERARFDLVAATSTPAG